MALLFFQEFYKMSGIFEAPHPYLKPKPPRYPKWDDPVTKPPAPGTYRMSANDLKISLEDSQKTKNFTEYQENINVRLITNDGSKQSLVWLAMARNIFHKELQKMPEQYITRLVFNKKHFTVVLIQKGVVIGGICFRPFFDQDHEFAEIAFCAVSSTVQVRGYGAYVMACVKTCLQVMGINNILTYADNSAVNYFKRQGFTLSINFPREKWQRCIKDYQGATLIHCKIQKNVDYMYIHSITDEQKRFVSKLLPDYVIHRATKWPIGQIQGITIDKPAEFNVVNQMRIIIQQAKLHSKAWPFLQPVNTDEAPSYLELIQTPMDFSKLEKNMNEGKYKTLEQFRDDMWLIFQNCYTFNGLEQESVYIKAALDLEKYSEKLFEEHRMGHRRGEKR